MLTLIPGIFHLLMGLLMFRYKVTDSYYNEMIHQGSTSQDMSDGIDDVNDKTPLSVPVK